MTLSKQEQVEARARGIHLRRVRGGKRGYKRWLKDSLKESQKAMQDSLRAITAPDGKRYNISEIGLNRQGTENVYKEAKRQSAVTNEPLWLVVDRLAIAKRQEIAMLAARSVNREIR